MRHILTILALFFGGFIFTAAPAQAWTPLDDGTWQETHCREHHPGFGFSDKTKTCITLAWRERDTNNGIRAEGVKVTVSHCGWMDQPAITSFIINFRDVNNVGATINTGNGDCSFYKDLEIPVNKQEAVVDFVYTLEYDFAIHPHQTVQTNRWCVARYNAC